MSKFGAFVAGLGTGVAAGQKMRLDRERADREAASAGLRTRRDTVEVERMEREDADRRAIEDAGRSAFAGPSGAQNDADGNPMPQVQDGRAPEEKILVGIEAMQETAIKRGRIDLATKYFSDASGLRGEVREKAFQRADAEAAKTGNAAPYLPIYNRFIADGKTIDPASYQMTVGPDGKPVHSFEVVDGDKRVPRTVPDNEMRRMLETARNPQAMRQLELRTWVNAQDPKVQAEIKKSLAQAEYLSGRNDAGIEQRRVTGESRENVAEIRADSLAERGIGTGGRAGAGGGRAGAGSTQMYGGDKGAAKWVDDFEKHYIQKRDVKNEDGSNKIDPKTGSPVQEVDDEIARPMRDMVRENFEAISAAGLHPQEAASLFGAVARAAKTGDPAKVYEGIDKTGKLVIRKRTEDGQPDRAALELADGVLAKLPRGIEDAILTQAFKNMDARQKAYPDETKRGSMRNAKPASADVAKRGLVQQRAPGTIQRPSMRDLTMP